MLHQRFKPLKLILLMLLGLPLLLQLFLKWVFRFQDLTVQLFRVQVQPNLWFLGEIADLTLKTWSFQQSKAIFCSLIMTSSDLYLLRRSSDCFDPRWGIGCFLPSTFSSEEELVLDLHLSFARPKRVSSYHPLTFEFSPANPLHLRRYLELMMNLSLLFSSD